MGQGLAEVSKRFLRQREVGQTQARRAGGHHGPVGQGLTVVPPAAPPLSSLPGLPVGFVSTPRQLPGLLTSLRCLEPFTDPKVPEDEGPSRCWEHSGPLAGLPPGHQLAKPWEAATEAPPPAGCPPGTRASLHVQACCAGLPASRKCLSRGQECILFSLHS